MNEKPWEQLAFLRHDIGLMVDRQLVAKYIDLV